MRRLHKYFLVVLLAICVTASSKEPEVVETDVCSLVAHSKQFDKKQVKVRARMIRSIHGAALVDSRCKQGVELWIAKDARDHPDFQDLSERVDRQGNIGTSDKVVLGTFTGQFLRYPKDPVIRHRKVLVLNATKIEDLDVKYNSVAHPQ